MQTIQHFRGIENNTTVSAALPIVQHQYCWGRRDGKETERLELDGYYQGRRFIRDVKFITEEERSTRGAGKNELIEILNEISH